MSRIFLALFAVSCIIQLGLSFHLQYVPPNQSLKLHFVPDPQYLKSISGTFRPLLAQAFFMKGALELARNASQKVDYL
ncbi:MAG TPA: hypothetical protein PKO06_19770, partial [Candidatus Ozemobacteraceae bacterium]|nr:hypothetical protein [Candidatus Ozemobacteraceae bacterium]